MLVVDSEQTSRFLLAIFFNPLQHKNVCCMFCYLDIHVYYTSLKYEI